MNTETKISVVCIFVAFFMTTSVITLAVPTLAYLDHLTVKKPIEKKASIVPPNAPSLIPPKTPALAPSLKNMTNSTNTTK
jgi:hypothetical protein